MVIRYSRFVFASMVLAVMVMFAAQSIQAQMAPKSQSRSKATFRSRVPVTSQAQVVTSKAPVDDPAKGLIWPRLMDVSELDVTKTQLYVVLRGDSFLSHSGDSNFNPFSSSSPSLGPDTPVYVGIFMHVNNNSADAQKLNSTFTDGNLVSTLQQLNYYIAFNQGLPAIYDTLNYTLSQVPGTLPWNSSIFSGGVKSIRQAGMGDATEIYYVGAPKPELYIRNSDDGTLGANFAINTSYMLCEVMLRTQSASALRIWQNLTPPFKPPYPGQVAPFAGAQLVLPLTYSQGNPPVPFHFFAFGRDRDPGLRDYTPDRLADYADATPPPMRVFKPEPLQNLFLQETVPDGESKELVWASHPVLSGLVDQVIQIGAVADREWHFPTWTAYREEPSQQFALVTDVKLQVTNGAVKFIFPVNVRGSEDRYLISVLTQADLPPSFDFNQTGQMYAFIPISEGFATAPSVQNGCMTARTSSQVDKTFLLREHLSIDASNRTMQIAIGSDVSGDCEVWLFRESTISFGNPTQGKTPTCKFSIEGNSINRFVSANLENLDIDNIGSMVIRPVNKQDATITIDYVRFE